MTRFAIPALVLAAFASNALADGTYVSNDKLRRIYIAAPSPATVEQPAAKTETKSAAAEQPYALTGNDRPQTVRTVNDKGRRLD
jgi:hypothetical protein